MSSYFFKCARSFFLSFRLSTLIPLIFNAFPFETNITSNLLKSRPEKCYICLTNASMSCEFVCLCKMLFFFFGPICDSTSTGYFSLRLFSIVDGIRVIKRVYFGSAGNYIQINEFCYCHHHHDDDHTSGSKEDGTNLHTYIGVFTFVQKRERKDKKK